MTAHRSGFVALVGRPNVGKSTLLNALVGETVASVTSVPGTTRAAVRGILTLPDAQMVFVDLPGVGAPKTLLARRLNALVQHTTKDVDLVTFVIDGAAGIGGGDRHIAADLAYARVPVVCIVNKQDRLKGGRILPVLEQAASLGAWADIVPVSATTGENLDRLTVVMLGHLPEGPALFPAGSASDRPVEDVAAEIIRSNYLGRLSDELPHSVAVVVDPIEPRDDDGPFRVEATLYVERESQKGIVIGKGGQLLRDANTAARRELETRLGGPVFLAVRVKLAKEWQRDPKLLNRLGF